MTSATRPAPTVDRRTLNRTLLARQWLQPTAPPGASVLDVVGQVVGLQAQSPSAPYVGVWSRRPTSAPGELADALTGRAVVRMATLRNTVHLHTAPDAVAVRAWVQPLLEAQLRTSRAAAWPHVDRDALVAEVRGHLADGPVAASTLGERLHRRWPRVSPADLHQFARALLPLVQVPPRGVWGRSGATTYAELEPWLGGPAGDPARGSTHGPVCDPAELVRRYLAAYGPASVRDVQTWSGLTRLAEVTGAMDLRRYRDEDGTELVDLDLPLGDPDLPVPPVFLAPFDDVTLSHADRRRVVDDVVRRRISASNGMVPGMVLVDGSVAATWRAGRDALQVTTLRPLSRRAQASLQRPGRALLRWLTGAVGEVVVAPDVGG